MEEKQHIGYISVQCFVMFKGNKVRVFASVLTMEETWIHHSTPETKLQSKQWIRQGESFPKNLVSVFWHMHDIIFIDYLQKGRIINGEYCAKLMERFNDECEKGKCYYFDKNITELCTSPHVSIRDEKYQ